MFIQFSFQTSPSSPCFRQALVKAIPRRAGDLSSRGLGAVCGALARWRAASVPLLAALAKSVSALEPGEVATQLQGRGCVCVCLCVRGTLWGRVSGERCQEIPVHSMYSVPDYRKGVLYMYITW